MDPTATNIDFGQVQQMSQDLSDEVLQAIAVAKQQAPMRLVRLGFYGYAVVSNRLPFWARVIAAILGYMEYQELRVIQLATPPADGSVTVDATAVGDGSATTVPNATVGG